MITDYYKLPFKPGRLMSRSEHPKCSLPESVAALIHLIVLTNFGDYSHDPTFGCEIWEHDFENISNSQIYREKLRSSIQETIEKHEPRLSNVKVTVQIDQIDYRVTQRRIKSRIRLRIDATLAMTNEAFSYSDQFFIGPLSYD
jgi:phage baseplate assembly protein W